MLQNCVFNCLLFMCYISRFYSSLFSCGLGVVIIIPLNSSCGCSFRSLSFESVITALFRGDLLPCLFMVLLWFWDFGLLG